MKVSELIQNLMTMDPDRDILCLVAKDDQLRVYDTDIARNTVTRMQEVEDYEVLAHKRRHPAFKARGRYVKNIWSVDIHGHWDEQKQAKGRRDEGRRANL